MDHTSRPIDLAAEIREFQYPLNVYAELLRLETGRVDYLHYGLFLPGEQDVARAQRRHCELVLERLPAAPARILEIGIGMGTMAAELAGLGYRVTGITPDAAQVRIACATAPGTDLVESRFETFTPEGRYDLLLFQESSQYIDAAALFAQAARCCAPNAAVLILDEFATGPLPQTLQSLEYLVSQAAAGGFSLIENIDLSAMAAATVDYLLDAVERRKSELEARLVLGPDALTALCNSNRDYRSHYADGTYQYRCLRFTLE
jgi:SAM-dependent methyltransferase